MAHQHDQGHCGVGHDLTYHSSSLIKQCPVKEYNGLQVQLLPKEIPGVSITAGAQKISSNHICRFPDCLVNPCKHGLCEETIRGSICHCPPEFTGHRCEVQIPVFAKALGMESKTIPDASITASSKFDNNFGPEKGRLNGSTAWVTSATRYGQWIQVDLEHPTCIVGLATQGRRNNPQWVTEYKVGCGLQAEGIVMVTENSSSGVSEKVFSGNEDQDTVVYNGLPEPHVCRFVRVYPVSWNYHPSMRMELYTATG
ncbi:adipocyte enhancer-binding protein 1-like [Diadema setosum]|uniref:adipocyte enhancer-binding protein 1-like n=1 Tax=Diadema setosum TaxID=31175 RepID=UPI003B3B6D3C